MVSIPGIGTIGGGGTGSVGYNESTQQSGSQQTSSSFIPNFSQTPILENIAQYAENMAPQVYDWGMQQYNANQGNINQMMQQAQTYASPERIQAEMGMAEAGVAQANEAARQSSISDLQSYGIDPSSGRYAELDQANRVMGAAGVAGAGNQQRMATQATGNALQQQALSASLQNVATGYGAAQGLTNLLGTGMQLKYSPLGTSSQGTSFGSGQSLGFNVSGGGTGSGAGSGYWMRQAGGAAGGPGVAKGGYISPDLSDSHGEEVDDVPAQLNAGEFVIPKDIVKWKGKEFFYKLIAQTRKARASGQQPQQQQGTGYQQGGDVQQGQPQPIPYIRPPMPSPQPAQPPDISSAEGTPQPVPYMRPIGPPPPGSYTPAQVPGYQMGGQVQKFLPYYYPSTGPGSVPTVDPEELENEPQVQGPSGEQRAITQPQPIRPAPADPRAYGFPGPDAVGRA